MKKTIMMALVGMVVFGTTSIGSATPAHAGFSQWWCEFTGGRVGYVFNSVQHNAYTIEYVYAGTVCTRN